MIEEPVEKVKMPEVGDYIIIKLEEYVIHGLKNDSKYHEKESQHLYEFFNTHIGKILRFKDRNDGDYYIEFEYDEKYLGPEFYGENKFELYLMDFEIEFFSNDKNEAETYLKIKKYNL